MKNAHLIIAIVAMLGLAGMFVHSAEAGAVTYTFQQGADGYTGAEDNLLVDGARALSNYGTYGSIIIGDTSWSGSYGAREVMRFDLSGISSMSGTAVESVTLTLQSYLVAGSGTYDVFSILPANKGWGEETSCWNCKILPNLPWAGANGLGESGTDYDATALGTESWTTSTTGTVVVEFDNWTQANLTAMVESWMTPSTNAGILLKAQTENNNYYYRPYSKENATVSNRPLLTVTFVPEPLSVTLMGFAALPLLLKRRNR